MNKRLLTYILCGAGLVLVLFSVILLCSSASLVGDVEGVINKTIMSEMGGGYGYSDFGSIMGGFSLDIDLDAGILREAKSLLNDLIDEIPGVDVSIKDVLSQFGVKGAGFKLFALTMRGWFFWVGILCLVAAVVVVAFEANSKLLSMIIETAKAFGAAVVAGVRNLFSGIKLPAMPKRAPRVMYGCPSCGAPFAPGTTFCGSCGAKLPDPSTIGVCKNCGTRNEPGARFCSGCGQPMA